MTSYTTWSLKKRLTDGTGRVAVITGGREEAGGGGGAVAAGAGAEGSSSQAPMGALPLVGTFPIPLEAPAYAGVERGAKGMLGLGDGTPELAAAPGLGAFLKASISTFPTGL